MNRFALAAIAGTASLLISVPVFAQTVTKDPTIAVKTRPVPTQACVQALAEQEAAALASFDARTAARKSVLQNHHAAIVAAAAITDDTARVEALKKAHEEMRTALKTAMESFKPDTASLEKVKAACGKAVGGKFLFGPGVRQEKKIMKGNMIQKRLDMKQKKAAQ